MSVEMKVSQEDLDMMAARLTTLSLGGANRASRKAIRAGLRVLRDAMRQSAPVKKGQLRKSIGVRFRKVRRGPNRGVIEAKAGLNVGKKPRKKSSTPGGEDRPNDAYAPHAHLVALGTRPRWQGVKYGRRSRTTGEFETDKDELTGNKIKYTGIMPANPFVRWAAHRVENSAVAAVRRRFYEAFDQEIRRQSGGGR